MWSVAWRTAWFAILVGSACVLDACGGGGEDSGSGPAAGVATHLSVTAASSTASGRPFNVTVSALDGAGSVVSAYSGTVHLTSTDSQAVLAANSTLTNGAGTFSVTLTTPGSQTVTATDTASPSISGTSGAINVAAAEVVITSGAPPDGKVGHLYSPGITTYCQPIGGRCTPCTPGGNRGCGAGFRTVVSGLFDPTAGLFTATRSMATTRAYHTATLLDDGTVLVTGGFDYGSSVTASAEVFDPVHAAFSPTGEMGTPRYFHAACLLNDGRVLVTGGRDGDTGPLSTAELYD